MTIDEAIKMLEKTPIQVVSGNIIKYGEARQLGIEALKRVKTRRLSYLMIPDPLPGETEG